VFRVLFINFEIAEQSTFWNFLLLLAIRYGLVPLFSLSVPFIRCAKKSMVLSVVLYRNPYAIVSDLQFHPFYVDFKLT